MRLLLFHALIVLLGWALSASAQEDATSQSGSDDSVATESVAEEAAEPEADDAAEDDAEPEIDLDDPAFAGLDEQNYEEPDDDFIPTEEIPADQAIPFPTDI